MSCNEAKILDLTRKILCFGLFYNSSSIYRILFLKETFKEITLYIFSSQSDIKE